MTIFSNRWAQGLAGEDALAKGLAEKSEEFAEQGSEVYARA